MKRQIGQQGEVLPALQRGARSAPVPAAGAAGARLRFDTRVTRNTRFPLEQALAQPPRPSRLGRFLDIEV